MVVNLWQQYAAIPKRLKLVLNIISSYNYYIQIIRIELEEIKYFFC